MWQVLELDRVWAGTPVITTLEDITTNFVSVNTSVLHRPACPASYSLVGAQGFSSVMCRNIVWI